MSPDLSAIAKKQFDSQTGHTSKIRGAKRAVALPMCREWKKQWKDEV